MKNKKPSTPPIAHIRRTVGKTIHQYNLIRHGDTILVGISGGKDSWCLLHLLHYFQSISPVYFELVPTFIDAGFPGFDTQLLAHTCRRFFPSLDIQIIKTSIYETIRLSNSPGKNPCAFCARLRRGALYKTAAKLNCNVIALGHHADDALETLFMSLAFEGTLTSIPPVMFSPHRKIKVIRPLILTYENDIKLYSRILGFPEICCTASWNTSSKAKIQIESIVRSLKNVSPLSHKHMLSALKNVKISRFLDKKWL